MLPTGGTNAHAMRWLSLTPEPERELPASVAALRAGGPATAGPSRASAPAWSASSFARARRAWLEYLNEVVDLIERNRPGRRERAGVALEVVRNHTAAARGRRRSTADERERLDAAAGKTANGGRS